MKALIFVLLFWPLISFAGKDIGNTDVIVCADGSVKLLDFHATFETRLTDLTYDPSPAKTVLGKVQDTLEFVKRLDQTRARRYQKWLFEFIHEKNMEFVRENLPEIPDSGYTRLLDGCKLEQAAVLRKPSFFEKKRIRVNLNLWERMTDDQKSGLIFHEFLYRDANAMGATDTAGIRHINALFHSKQFKTMSLEAYFHRLGVFGVFEGDTHLGFPIIVPPFHFANNRLSRVVQFWDDSTLRQSSPPSGNFDLTLSKNCVLRVRHPGKKILSYHPTGVPEELQGLLSLKTLKRNCTDSAELEITQLSPTFHSIGFFADGAIEHIYGGDFLLVENKHVYRVRDFYRDPQTKKIVWGRKPVPR